MGDEISPEVINATRKILGKYVTRPALSEKLLKKPPFRFIHDVIAVVIKDTGFLKGLYSEAELLSDNVKDRDTKVAFLNKLITAVKTISGEDLTVRASKIIAGLEPEETNKLLQAIGSSIEKKLDSKEYVKEIKAKNKPKIKENEKVDKNKRAKSKGSVQSNESNKGKAKPASRESPKVERSSKGKEAITKTSASKTDLNQGKREVKTVKKTTKKDSAMVLKDSPKNIKESPKTTKESPKNVKESPRNMKESPRNMKASPRSTKKVEEKPNKSNETNNEINNASQDSIENSPRPDTTTTNATGDEVDAAVVNQNQQIANLIEETQTPTAEDLLPNESEFNINLEKPQSARPKPESLIIRDNKITPMEKVEDKIMEKKLEFPMRPKSSLRPPSVRPSSARPGAPRLRPDSSLPLKEPIPLGKINVIIENYDAPDNKEDDEETVVIQNIIEDIPETLEKTFDIPVDKGHLVEQILEQIEQPEQLEEPTKSTSKWEQEGVRGRDSTAKEITQLRASIQALTRTANPLGKLMSYLHEDVEAMHLELDSWMNMKRQYLSEITKQKRTNAESNYPLITQLQDLEENIKKQREEIAMVKFNILKNEERIKDLIGKQVIVQ